MVRATIPNNTKAIRGIYHARMLNKSLGPPKKDENHDVDLVHTQKREEMNRSLFVGHPSRDKKGAKH